MSIYLASSCHICVFWIGLCTGKAMWMFTEHIFCTVMFAPVLNVHISHTVHTKGEVLFLAAMSGAMCHYPPSLPVPLLQKTKMNYMDNNMSLFLIF